MVKRVCELYNEKKMHLVQSTNIILFIRIYFRLSLEFKNIF